MEVQIWDKKKRTYIKFNEVIKIYTCFTYISLEFKDKQAKEFSTQRYKVDFIYQDWAKAL